MEYGVRLGPGGRVAVLGGPLRLTKLDTPQILVRAAPIYSNSLGHIGTHAPQDRPERRPRRFLTTLKFLYGKCMEIRDRQRLIRRAA